MKVALVALTVCGCGTGLPVSSACRYEFAAPSSDGGISQRCTVTSDGALSLRFDDVLQLTVADGAASGHARFEGADTARAALAVPGERFGLASVGYEGHECADWAGHVFWDVTPEHWHVEAVGTSSCGFTFAVKFDSP
jgi:hypothetical protein